MAVSPLPWATLTIPPAGQLNGTARPAEVRQLSAAGSRSVSKLTYGQDRIGGDILNIIKAGATSTTVLVQVWWGFAGSAVASVQLNAQDLPGTATVTTYLGNQTTADSALVAAFAAQSITYTDTLEGFAYSVIALPQSAIGTELQFTCLYSGRKLYDPRKDSTAGGTGSHRLAAPSTWEFSDSPALALGDYLSNSVYGAGEPVNWSSVAATANANDALVGSPAEKRRILGVTFASVATVTDIADTLRSYAGCFLLPSASGVTLLPDADDSPVAHYDHADGTIASITGLQLRDLGNSPTTVEIIYTDTTVVPWRDASAFAELPGAGETIPYRLSQVRMPGVHRYSQARREAIERLNKLTLQDLSTTIEIFDIGIRHSIGDIITLTHPIGVTNKLFRVTGTEATQAGRWVLPLIEHDPACYSSVVETVPTYSNSGTIISEAGGSGGISSYMIEIYLQAPTQPATPHGGQYTFVGDVFVPPVSWSRDQPTGTLVPTWASRYLVQTTTPAVTIDIPAGVCTLGPTWAASTVANRNHQSIAYGNGRFVIGELLAGNGVSQWSADGGATWTESSGSVTSFGLPLMVSFGGGIFFAHVNALTCATSTDGDTWTSFSHTSISSTAQPVYGFGQFYVFGSGFYYIGGSAGEIGSGTVPTNTATYGGAFGNDLMVTLGDNGGASAAGYSTDGINFIAATTAPAVHCSRVVFGAGRFVAVPALTTSSLNFYHTTDGVTWAAVAAPVSRIWTDIVFAQGAFLAICSGTSGDEIARSEDGLTWAMVDASQRFTASAGFQRIVASETGQYVALNLGTSTAINRGGCVAEGSWSVPNKHVVNGADGVTPSTDGPLVFPGTFDAYKVTDSPENAVSYVEFRRNGSVYGGSPETYFGDWHLPNVSDAGDDYEVRADVVLVDSVDGLAGVTGSPISEWVPLTDSVSWTLTTSENATTRRVVKFNYAIRRISDSVQVSTGFMILDASVDAG